MVMPLNSKNVMSILAVLPIIMYTHNDSTGI